MLNRSALTLFALLAACSGPTSEPETTREELVSKVTQEIQEPRETPRIVSEGILADAVPITEPDEAEPEPPTEPSPELATFELRRGETLAHFARWSEVPVEAIAEASDLDLDGEYPVGTEVRVPVSGEDLERLQSLRDEHRGRRVEGYLASRGGSVGTETYKVKTGDSAWGIARNQGGIPVWLLGDLNPEVDLEKLRPGMQLELPVLADVVVDAE